MVFGCTVRKYGKGPFKVAVIHGGPGAPGSVAPVARQLSANRGVLEPLQTADSLEGQLDELKTQLIAESDLPAVLIGHSWGAMLSYLFAARYTELVSKIIMVGSGVYEDKYAENILNIRLSHLDESEREEASALMKGLSDPNIQFSDAQMARMGELLSKTDVFAPIDVDEEPLESTQNIDPKLLGCQSGLHKKVWGDAKKLRKSGGFLDAGKLVRCPVVAIHGDYDSHPPEGVRDPLSMVLSDFRFIMLERCGHEPWRERYARDRFFEVIEQELSSLGEGNN